MSTNRLLSKTELQEMILKMEMPSASKEHLRTVVNAVGEAIKARHLAEGHEAPSGYRFIEERENFVRKMLAELRLAKAIAAFQVANEDVIKALEMLFLPEEKK